MYNNYNIPMYFEDHFKSFDQLNPVINLVITKSNYLWRNKFAENLFFNLTN